MIEVLAGKTFFDTAFCLLQHARQYAVFCADKLCCPGCLLPLARDLPSWKRFANARW